MKKLFLLLALVAISGFAYYHYYTTTPTYSLLRASAAVLAHDPAAFNHYIDVESVAGSLVEEVAQQDGPLGGRSVGSLLTSGLGAALKTVLAAEARREVNEYIETGSVRRARTEGSGGFSLAAMVGAIISDSAEFKGVAYEKTQAGGMAEVGLEFTQPRYDTTVLVKLRLADRGDHWQVKKIANVGEIIANVALLEKRRLISRSLR